MTENSEEDSSECITEMDVCVFYARKLEQVQTDTIARRINIFRLRRVLHACYAMNTPKSWLSRSNKDETGLTTSICPVVGDRRKGHQAPLLVGIEQ